MTDRMTQGPETDVVLCTALIAGCRELTRLGLTYGTSGNVSLRRDTTSFFVSPTGMAYETLQPHDVPLVTLDGRWFGRRRPSSEWRFHRDIMAVRSEVGAIVHTLEGRKACLLAHHGLIATGIDLPAALKLAGEVESLAAQYCAARALGNVGLLEGETLPPERAKTSARS